MFPIKTIIRAGVSALVLLLLLACGCACRPAETQAEIVPLLGSGSFRVEAETLGTSAQGSVLVYEKGKNVLGIRLAALIRVGPEDWGGVAFALPAGCRLENVLCSYPEDGEGSPPVVIWTTADDEEKYTCTVEIARSRSQEPTGGGTGTVFIEATFPYAGQDPPERLDFAVECGGGVKNGSVYWGEAYGEIPVELRSRG